MGWIKNLVGKFVGKKIANGLKLEEGKPMEEGKKWYQSKTVLAGITTVLLGAYDLARLNLAPSLGWNLPEIPSVVYSILGGIGIYGRVTASKPIS